MALSTTPPCGAAAAGCAGTRACSTGASRRRSWTSAWACCSTRCARAASCPSWGRPSPRAWRSTTRRCRSLGWNMIAEEHCRQTMPGHQHCARESGIWDAWPGAALVGCQGSTGDSQILAHENRQEGAQSLMRPGGGRAEGGGRARAAAAVHRGGRGRPRRAQAAHARHAARPPRRQGARAGPVLCALRGCYITGTRAQLPRSQLLVCLGVTCAATPN